MTKRCNVTKVRTVRLKKPKIRRNTTNSRKKKVPIQTETKPNENNVVGYVFCGNTKYIDVETKEKRRYLVTKQKGSHVTVSKLQSIKQFDKNGRNADKHLIEINQNYPGLTKRTGVDFWQYTKNRMSGKPLSITDSKIFKNQPEFAVSGKDLNKAQIHTKIKKYNKH